jgi:chromate transport protein ChrA
VLWLLLLLLGVFALAAAARFAGLRRNLLVRKWPTVLLGLAAAFVLWRGLWGPAIVIAGLAWLAWLWPSETAPPMVVDEAADREARAVLGVSASATPEEIRTAYRARMRAAHPDRGGSHAEASRLTAARDRLLRTRSST